MTEPICDVRFTPESGHRLTPYNTFAIGTDNAIVLATFIISSGVGITLVHWLRTATRASEALARQREVLTETDPNGILVVDAEGRIQLVNGQLTKLFGYRHKGQLLAARWCSAPHNPPVELFNIKVAILLGLYLNDCLDYLHRSERNTALMTQQNQAIDPPVVFYGLAVGTPSAALMSALGQKQT